jgi:predicted O-methyltransferase YrrM
MFNFSGQLCAAEREILIGTLSRFRHPTILEVGTYKGGGSTITFLQELFKSGGGILYGIESDSSNFSEMQDNIRGVNPELLTFFKPRHGFSQQVIPQVLAEVSCLNMVFLDGGNNPREQIEEFELVKDAIPVGGWLLSHDANLRKGRWLVPFITELDNWRVTIHQVSEEGLLQAEKLAPTPSAESARRAAKKLTRLKLSLVEFATTLFPSRFKAMFLQSLPHNLTRRLAEGRRLPPTS